MEVGAKMGVSYWHVAPGDAVRFQGRVVGYVKAASTVDGVTSFTVDVTDLQAQQALANQRLTVSLHTTVNLEKVLGHTDGT